MDEKIVGRKLDHNKLLLITKELSVKYRKRRFEIVVLNRNEIVNRILLREELAMKVITGCAIIATYKFKTRLGFKKYDAVLTRGQSLPTKIMSSFEGENIHSQYIGLH